MCVLVLCIILVAGLWPFNPHSSNQVTWLKSRNGLQFGDHSILFSPDPFERPDVQFKKEASTLEIWLQPTRANANRTILTFYNTMTLEKFTLRQYGDALVVQAKRQDHQASLRNTEFDVEHAFKKDLPVFITITSDSEGVEAYLNGSLVMQSASPRLTAKDLSGQLIIGPSPVDNNAWSGRLLGLALYKRALNSADALSSYANWIQSGKHSPAEDKNVLAFYPFDERAGRLVHSHASSGADLTIPESFTVLHKPFLSAPWYDFQISRSYLEDVTINIAGFVPLGFFFYAYFAPRRSNSAFKTSVAVILLGGTISLLIEVLQFYLPTRDSSLKDVVTNTLGTGFGVLFFKILYSEANSSQAPQPLREKT
jgi:hypothetical protein